MGVSRKKRTLKRNRRRTRNLRKKTLRKQRFCKKCGGGGYHHNEDCPHYHLMVRFTHIGFTKEINPLFEGSCPEGKVFGENEDFKPDTVKGIRDCVKDLNILRTDDENDANNFKLYWKGKLLDDPSMEIRNIVVDGSKLPLYMPNRENPIEVVFDGDVVEKYKR